jgi:hypothetical protein
LGLDDNLEFTYYDVRREFAHNAMQMLLSQLYCPLQIIESTPSGKKIAYNPLNPVCSLLALSILNPALIST